MTIIPRLCLLASVRLLEEGSKALFYLFGSVTKMERNSKS